MSTNDFETQDAQDLLKRLHASFDPEASEETAPSTKEETGSESGRSEEETDGIGLTEPTEDNTPEEDGRTEEIAEAAAEEIEEAEAIEDTEGEAVVPAPLPEDAEEESGFFQAEDEEPDEGTDEEAEVIDEAEESECREEETSTEEPAPAEDFEQLRADLPVAEEVPENAEEAPEETASEEGTEEPETVIEEAAKEEPQPIEYEVIPVDEVEEEEKKPRLETPIDLLFREEDLTPAEEAVAAEPVQEEPAAEAEVPIKDAPVPAAEEDEAKQTEAAEESALPNPVDADAQSAPAEEADEPVPAHADESVVTVPNEEAAAAPKEVAPSEKEDKVPDTPDFSEVTAEEMKQKVVEALVHRDTKDASAETAPAESPAPETNVKKDVPAASKKRLTTTITLPAEKPKKKRFESRPNAVDPVDDSLEESLDDTSASLGNDAPLIEELPVDEPEVQVPTRGKGSIFRRHPKRGRNPAKMTPNDIVRAKSGLSEDDVAMMLELGYENDLGRVVGFETMRKLIAEHQRKSGQESDSHYRSAFGFEGLEYGGDVQNAEVTEAYERDHGWLIARVAVTAVVTLLLLLFELPVLLGSHAAAFLWSHPVSGGISCLLLLLLASFFANRQLNAGVRDLVFFKPSAYSIPSLVLPVLLFYNAFGLLPWVNMPTMYLPGAVLLLAMAISDSVRFHTEFSAFRMVSAGGEKTVLEKVQPRKKKLRRGNKIVKILNDNIDENLFRVVKTKETTGFFRRFNSFRFANRPLNFIIIATFFASILTAFLYCAMENDFTEGLYSLVGILAFAAPVSAMFGIHYPLNRANRLLRSRNCVLLGQEAVEEFGEDKTVAFSDTDLFFAQKHAEIRIRDSLNAAEDKRLAQILFRKVGGTLGSLGGEAPAEGDPSVAFLRIADNGIEAMIDSKNHLLCGSAAFLAKAGVRVPRESSDRALKRAPNVGQLYVSVDGVVKLSYEIEYLIHPEFERTVLAMTSCGTKVTVLSYDPNLNDAFLASIRRGKPLIYVYKPGRYEADTVEDLCDPGILTLGKKTSVAFALRAATDVFQSTKRIFRFQCITSVLGIGVCWLALLFAPTGFSLGLAASLYQLLSVSASFLIPYRYLTAERIGIRK